MSGRANFRLKVSRRLEKGARAEGAAARRARWLEQNEEAIREHNKRVTREGVFSDALRRF